MTWIPAPSFLIGSYGAAILSALLPWINAELLLLTALPMAQAQGAPTALVLVVTLGQMTGKTFMYWVSRNARGALARQFKNGVNRWRSRFEHHPRSAIALVLVSALVGLPPFYAVSIAAGVFRMRFAYFLAAGSIGCLGHFAIVALLPHIAWKVL